MKAIKFVKSVAPYVAGEVARFSGSEAKHYVALGAATFLEAPRTAAVRGPARTMSIPGPREDKKSKCKKCGREFADVARHAARMH